MAIGAGSKRDLDFGLLGRFGLLLPSPAERRPFLTEVSFDEPRFDAPNDRFEPALARLLDRSFRALFVFAFRLFDADRFRACGFLLRGLKVGLSIRPVIVKPVNPSFAVPRFT